MADTQGYGCVETHTHDCSRAARSALTHISVSDSFEDVSPQKKEKHVNSFSWLVSSLCPCNMTHPVNHISKDKSNNPQKTKCKLSHKILLFRPTDILNPKILCYTYVCFISFFKMLNNYREHRRRAVISHVCRSELISQWLSLPTDKYVFSCLTDGSLQARRQSELEVVGRVMTFKGS